MPNEVKMHHEENKCFGVGLKKCLVLNVPNKI